MMQPRPDRAALCPRWLAGSLSGGQSECDRLLYHLHIWFGPLIAGSLKWLVFRYGGLPTYRRTVPFFLGIILGEFVIGGIWSLIDVFWGIPTYSFQQP